jgi:hypothetical protein
VTRLSVRVWEFEAPMDGQGHVELGEVSKTYGSYTTMIKYEVMKI